MKILVIGMNGLGLAPTTPGKTRRLLKDKRATVVCRQPFTIRLKYKTGCAHPELALGEDTGSQHIGFAIVEKLSEDSGHKLIPVNTVCFRTHCNNWAVYTTKTIVM